MARVYATAGDYLDVTGDDRPVADHVLTRASGQVDAALLGAVYVADRQTGMPTNPGLIEVLRQATCEQAHALVLADHGEQGEGEASPLGTVTSASIGGASYTLAPKLPPVGYALDGGYPGGLCGTALDVLRMAGLLPVRPWVHG